MACRGCRKLGEMGSDRFLPCLAYALGLPGSHSDNWSLDLHVALYEELAKLAEVQNDRGEDHDTIAAVPWGSEPAATGVYVMDAPTLLFPADNEFWTCLGISAVDAEAQMDAESGAYYDIVSVAAERVARVEGAKKKDEGIPTWALVVGGLGVAGGVAYLVWGQ